LRRQLESGHTPAELGFSNMTPQEAISSEWLTWYSQGGGVETRFFEDAVATLRRLRTGLRIKALKIVSLAGQTESAVGVQLNIYLMSADRGEPAIAVAMR
jgi:hypothetical protein